MYCFVNGNFLDEDKATISIKDRGLRFGDGVFETMRVQNGRIYAIADHMARLTSGLTAIKIKCDIDEIKENLLQLIAKNNLQSGSVRIMVTRGEGSQGYLPTYISKPTIIIENFLSAADKEEAVSLWLSSYQKISPHALPVNYKLMQGLNSTLARMEALEHNCFEALQLSSDNLICECSSSNIFWFKDNILYTPSPKTGALGGVLKSRLISILPFKISEVQSDISALITADEVFITNVAWLIRSVKMLLPNNIIYNNFTKTKLALKIIEEDIKKSCYY